MPNDPHLQEPGRIDRYLPWSDEVPASCRLKVTVVDESEVLQDEPIVDASVLESLPEESQRSAMSLGKLLAVSNSHSGKLLP
jgi:hypothetical protein